MLINIRKDIRQLTAQVDELEQQLHDCQAVDIERLYRIVDDNAQTISNLKEQDNALTIKRDDLNKAYRRIPLRQSSIYGQLWLTIPHLNMLNCNHPISRYEAR